MRTVSDSVIGEYISQGYVEALVSVRQGPSLRVCVRVSDTHGKVAALGRADALLPNLISELGRVEAAVNHAVRQETGALVFDIWIEADGSASFTCGFLEGALEGDQFRVSKSEGGYLVY